MKAKLTLLAILISLTAIAQNGINYKAIIKNNLGNVVTNDLIQIQFSILQGVAQTNVYTETHTPTTDANGMIIVNIGAGTTSDVFTDIDWASDDHFLNVQIDTGNGFIDLGTTQFMTVPYAFQAEKAANVTGLETIDEGNGVGWRLIGSNPDNYGNIGFRSTDLSYSNIESTTYGATGTNAVTMGVRTSANGDSSLAMGSDSTASEDFTIAIGAGTLASEQGATSIGALTEASGAGSTAIGNYAEASGNNSTALGVHCRAASYYSTAVGRYNNGTGNATSWNDFDPLFEVGNGSSDSDRNNALTIYKNGRHIINSSSSGLTIYAETSGLNILYPNNNGIVISSPGENGIEITSANENGMVIAGATEIGIEVYSANEGARISGDTVGVYASGGSFTNDTPDIILGSSSSSLFSDDGIISTNPLRSGSDMFLRSYDAVVVQLDYDNNEAGNFRVQNGNNTTVFDVNEFGTVNMDGNLNTEGNLNADGRLRVGTAIIENVDTNFLQFNMSTLPSADGQFSLGAQWSRWANLWAVDGTINTSDRREKKNITDLKYGLAEILKIKPVSFNWKNPTTPDTKLGLIAQDLLEIIPEAVKTHIWETTSDNENTALKKVELDRLGVYYSDLIPVLIKAIQEQNKIIESQGDALKTSKSNYEALLSRIENLEANSSN